MPEAKAKIYIGTSGWVYGDWEGRFYPEDLASKDKLKYFSQHFKTVEVNYSFYHLPRPSTYQNWYNQTPKDFIFAVKASRFITHTCLAGRRVKRLKGVKQAWKLFLKNALNLNPIKDSKHKEKAQKEQIFYPVRKSKISNGASGVKEKLGPILFQFPPSFKATDENIKRLENFLKLINNAPRTVLGAFEFRHKSWCDKKIYEILKKHNVAWVIADSPNYPRADVVTTNFVYIRMHAPTPKSLVWGHGSKILFGSKYTKKELKDLAQKIKKWKKQKLDIYVYFNNDFHGYAVENAKELIELAR